MNVQCGSCFFFIRLSQKFIFVFVAYFVCSDFTLSTRYFGNKHSVHVCFEKLHVQLRPKISHVYWSPVASPKTQRARNTPFCSWTMDWRLSLVPILHVTRPAVRCIRSAEVSKCVVFFCCFRKWFAYRETNRKFNVIFVRRKQATFLGYHVGFFLPPDLWL